MDVSITIAIKDRSKASHWQDQAQQLNQKAEETVTAAMDDVNRIMKMCDGTLIDEFAGVANDLTSAAGTLFEAMNQIITVIDSLLSVLTNFISDATSAVSDDVHKYVQNL